MKILLVCAAGMSTSLVVEKMKKEANARGLSAEILAVPMEEFNCHVASSSVVLLGPQVRFKLAEYEKQGKEYGVPVAMINSMDYGLVNGKKILDAALALIR